LNAKPAQPTHANAKPAKSNDETLPLAAGGALALLALGGTAVALTRRRRRHEEEEAWVDEQPVAAEPMTTGAAQEPERLIHEQEPAMAAPSAFAWGNQAQTDAAARTDDDMDDRRPGESWVDRAYRGTSANNPSVSLRARLKRAAFFDKREREAAAGVAEPVDATAGLPDAMVDEQERELA
jgi:hypothetical protein